MRTKERLTVQKLRSEAVSFCIKQSVEKHPELLGVTDGKAVGTYIEHLFKETLASKFDVILGSSASGIDLPSPDINTDIKATLLTQPQSSCPFKSARQKIYGLGYNILLFVYEKRDHAGGSSLQFRHCAFIDDSRTADYAMTTRLREILKDGGGVDDITAFFHDRNLPGDEIIYNALAEEILSKPPAQGVLTISNALQWRLQYARVIGLNNSLEGVFNNDWN